MASNQLTHYQAAIMLASLARYGCISDAVNITDTWTRIQDAVEVPVAADDNSVNNAEDGLNQGQDALVPSDAVNDNSGTSDEVNNAGDGLSPAQDALVLSDAADDNSGTSDEVTNAGNGLSQRQDALVLSDAADENSGTSDEVNKAGDGLSQAQDALVLSDAADENSGTSDEVNKAGDGLSQGQDALVLSDAADENSGTSDKVNNAEDVLNQPQDALVLSDAAAEKSGTGNPDYDTRDGSTQTSNAVDLPEGNDNHSTDTIKTISLLQLRIQVLEAENKALKELLSSNRNKEEVIESKTSATTSESGTSDESTTGHSSVQSDAGPSGAGVFTPSILSLRNLNNAEMIPIGSGATTIPASVFKRIQWTSYSLATRKLLMAVFSRKVLATHCLTGKRSHAFKKKAAKKRLNERKVLDIILTVVERCGVTDSIVRGCITSKCADEAKMYRDRQKKKKNGQKNAKDSECE